MRIRITRLRLLLQQAGTERPLNVGEVYDLPDVVAASLVATGAASLIAEEDSLAKEEAPPARGDVRPAETKPMTPPERKLHR